MCEHVDMQHLRDSWANRATFAARREVVATFWGDTANQAHAPKVVIAT